MKVSVIGAGSWGSALAYVLAKNNYSVSIHTTNPIISQEINNNRTNSKYLPNFTFPENIFCSTSYEETLKNTELVLYVVPSHAIREVVKETSVFLDKSVLVAHASKGIENSTLKTISEIISDELPHHEYQDIVVLSGPSHAEEVSKEVPTTVIAASLNNFNAETCQSMFCNDFFRVYTSNDVLGVELGGALKNIIALGAGISDGLGLGDNGKAALLTRGLSEIKRLGVSLGAQEATFSGLSGVGDLIVTGTSKHSRNWRTGYLLSQGLKLNEVLNEIGMVAEGVKTTKSAYHLSKKLDVDTPIIDALFDILYQNQEPKKALQILMNRDYKKED